MSWESKNSDLTRFILFPDGRESETKSRVQRHFWASVPNQLFRKCFLQLHKLRPARGGKQSLKMNQRWQWAVISIACVASFCQINWLRKFWDYCVWSERTAVTWSQLRWSKAISWLVNLPELFGGARLSNTTFCGEIFMQEEFIQEIIWQEIFCSYLFPKFNHLQIFQFSGQKRCNFVGASLKANVGRNAAFKWIRKESFPPQELHLLQSSHPRATLFALNFIRVYKLKWTLSVCVCVRHHFNFSTEGSFKSLIYHILLARGRCQVVSGDPRWGVYRKWRRWCRLSRWSRWCRFSKHLLCFPSTSVCTNSTH